MVWICPVKLSKKHWSNINYINILIDMRIIAGKLKGMIIKCPPGIIRPTTNRVMEAIFNIFRDWEGYRTLDLFAGSGCFSIEAFSRGASEAVLVEKDRLKIPILQSNLEKAGYTQVKIRLKDVLSFCKKTDQPFDFIFADPPYKWPYKNQLIELIGQNSFLHKDSIFIIEHPKKEKLLDSAKGLFLFDFRCYGLNQLSIYKTG